jgi:serine O-acetyltransferase
MTIPIGPNVGLVAGAGKLGAAVAVSSGVAARMALAPPARAATESPASVAPDWSREVPHRGRWEPGRRLLRTIRAYQAWERSPWLARKLARGLVVVRHRFWSAVAGVDIPLNTKLGGGLLLPHPHGVVIHPLAVVGPNCLIFQQVTIGKGGPRRGTPVVGTGVEIGAGAKVLGGITIGDKARIGANAVVLCDVPPGCTAVGIPAHILPRKPERQRDAECFGDGI